MDFGTQEGFFFIVPGLGKQLLVVLKPVLYEFDAVHICEFVKYALGKYYVTN